MSKDTLGDPAAPSGSHAPHEAASASSPSVSIPIAFTCGARKQSLPEPADCDWPFCGCDPYASKVIGALEECGVLQDRAAMRPSVVSELGMAARMIRTWIPESFPANERGQVHFVRAVIESVADVIERAVAEAQGIEARSGETALAGSIEDESPVGSADAPERI